MICSRLVWCAVAKLDQGLYVVILLQLLYGCNSAGLSLV